MEKDVDGDTGMGDCGVGTIVWVRRRNGSWWPGKILGPDELSASHLMSPRSGTPVKLLGREDASVDWYNLEKSKRVKPFRCGEFDDCIEKAEASQGMPPKKREKYARREDAILHALELEKQLLDKKYGKSNGLTTKLLLGNERKHTREISFDNGNSIMDLSLEEKRKGRLSLLDNNPDLHPSYRLRGLQDLGVGGGPVSSSSKYKHSSLATSNGFYKHAAAATDEITDDDRQVVVTTPESKNLLGNRKRSQEEEEEGEELMSKRRDRRRPLVQLLNNKSSSSSTKLSSSTTSHMHHHLLQLHGDDDDSVGEEQRQVTTTTTDPTTTTTTTIVVGNDQGMGIITSDSFNYTETQVEIPTSIVENRVDSFPVVGLSEDNNTSGSNEDTETDSSGTESLISDTSDAMAALSDENIQFIPKASGRSELQTEDESMSDDESGGHCPDDSGDSLQGVPTSVTVSKWQLKGKRNSRSSRYAAAATERKAAGGNNHHHHWMSFKEDDIYNYYGGADSFDRNFGSRQVVGFNSSSSMNWEDLTSQSLKGGGGYWEQQQSIKYHDPPPPLYVDPYFGGGRMMRSMLIDVDVQVQSGYQREHVPMISLMSKLNDKAIVGHPIPIETLEDGSSDIIIVSAAAAAAAADEFQMEASTLQPWRTSRRTSKCRVPRPSTFEEEDEEEEEDDAFEYVVDDESTWGINRSKGGTPRKTTLKKAQRKSTSLCNQKIRTLSSIGGSQQQQQQQQQPSLDLKDQCYDEGEGGVMKPELLPTAVACIPVKLVFSRLHEELVARHQ
ncbi:uncharacterized protein [Rutidosis leptorrhynchoides]|uniref:uncharacterized protein isoform X2 n=1 Tax=Rutidosis leptorrhynchoides TaxID=125765 RepID=UPI003A997484